MIQTQPNEVMMSYDGSMPTGVWVDYRTKCAFEIRDIFFEDNTMRILDTEGAMHDASELNTMTRYEGSLKSLRNELSSLSNEDERRARVGGTISRAQLVEGLDTSTRDELMSSTARQSTSSLLDGLLPSSNVVTSSNVTSTTNATTTNNIDIIAKVLSKARRPQTNVTFTWASFPRDEIAMLINTFDVDIDDIVNAIRARYINDDEINKIIAKYVREQMKRSTTNKKSTK